MDDIKLRNELINKHITLAKIMAKARKKNFPNINIDELEAAAFYGLAQAASRFNPLMGVEFAAFACRRISGAILDYAKELLDGKGKNRVRTEPLRHEVVSKSHQQPDFAHEGFERLIACLSEVHRRILRMHYINNDKYETIGLAVGLSEARVCQIIKESSVVLLERWDGSRSKLWE